MIRSHSSISIPIFTRTLTCLCFVLLLAFINSTSYAQNTAPSIYAMSLVKKNTVIIRWVPADYKTWKLGNRYGYKIERIGTNKDKPDTTLFSTVAMLTPSTILPFASADSNWKKLERENPNSALVYADLYNATQKNNSTKEEAAMWGLLMLTCNTSANISKAAGLYFSDASVNNNTVYAYRISIVKNKDTRGVKPEIITVDATQLPKPPAVPDSLRVKFGDRVATIKWRIPTDGEYDSYNIERSENNRDFKKVNKNPYVLMASQYEKNKTLAVYYDSINKNEVTFYYRIKGITPFGEDGSASQVVSGQGHVAFNMYPLIDSSLVIGNKKSVLTWHMPRSFQKKSLKGYAISRSDKDNGKFITLTMQLLQPDQQRYEDLNPLPANYYRIAAVSVYGDTAFSLSTFTQLQDLTPPAIPAGLTGKADAKGVVTLSWEANKEADLMGYRVFRSNSLTEEFVEVTRKILTAPAFTDTIAVRTLAKNIYYQLTAVDKVHNNSDYSTAVKIKRPDVVPPVEPAFTGITQNSKGIKLKWVPSSSDDVIKYELLRYNVSTNIPTPLKTWLPADTISTFTDSTVSNNTKYTYIINLSDDSDNKSKKISNIIEYVSGIPPVITDINTTVDRSKNKITLAWKYTEPGIYNYIIYKAKKGEPLRIYKTLAPTAASFEDGDSYIGNTYVYRIKAVFKNGTESPLSKVLEVVY